MNYFTRRIIPFMVLAGLLAMPLFQTAEAAKHRYHTRLQARLQKQCPEVGRKVRVTQTKNAEYQQDQSQNQPQQISLSETKSWTKKQWLSLFFVGLVLSGCAVATHKAYRGARQEKKPLPPGRGRFDVCHHEGDNAVICHRFPAARSLNGEVLKTILLESCLLKPDQPSICTETSLVGAPDAGEKSLDELVASVPSYEKWEEAVLRKKYEEMLQVFPSDRQEVPWVDTPPPLNFINGTKSQSGQYLMDRPSGQPIGSHYSFSWGNVSNIYLVGQPNFRLGVAAHEAGHWRQYVELFYSVIEIIKGNPDKGEIFRHFCGRNIETMADLFSVLVTQDSDQVHHFFDALTREAKKSTNHDGCLYAEEHKLFAPCTHSVIDGAIRKIKVKGRSGFNAAFLLGNAFSGKHPSGRCRVVHMLELLLKLPEIQMLLQQKAAEVMV